MAGISGGIHFEQGADPIKNIKIQRIEGKYKEQFTLNVSITFR